MDIHLITFCYVSIHGGLFKWFLAAVRGYARVVAIWPRLYLLDGGAQVSIPSG
jgi:hypothetical protein